MGDLQEKISPKVAEWQKNLLAVSKPEKIKVLSSFFKTGKGEYGEGDKFLGITVPKNREVAKKFVSCNFHEIEKMLKSEVHEFRLSALLVLVEKFKKEKESRKEIVNFYLAHTKWINNWDLIDLTCPKILGEYTLNGNEGILFTLSESSDMWEKRIAIVSTWTHIKHGKFDVALPLCEKYLNETHDLLRKATGWMLREIGKRDEKTLTSFLDRHYKAMPRTALRYSIERLSEAQKRHYMAK